MSKNTITRKLNYYYKHCGGGEKSDRAFDFVFGWKMFYYVADS